MINQLVLMGRIKKMEKYDDEIVIESTRPDKSKVTVHVVMSDSMLKSVREYCTLDDLIAIRGHLIGGTYMLRAEAEKVSFLSTRAGSVSDEDIINDIEGR